MTAFTCTDLTFNRGQQRVLDGVTFRSDQAQLIGILGPNGAGKTTLMRCLAGLAEPASGKVDFEGQSLATMPTTDRAKSIAFLPQDRLVHWALSCFEIVMLGRLPHRSGFGRPSARDRQVVADVMAQMDVEQFATRDFYHLSGGEKARILIARLLAQEPDLLIADEPVNGLDPAYQIALMQTFSQIVAGGKTVVTSLHDLPLASRWCTRLLLLDQGKLIADGTPQEVLTSQNMADIFKIQTGALRLKDQTVILPTDLIE